MHEGLTVLLSGDRTLPGLNGFHFQRLPPPPPLLVSYALSFHMSASLILFCVRGQIQVVPTN